jgi:hypothetical protein
MILMDNDKQRLWDFSVHMSEYLLNLRLRLHDRKRQVFRSDQWVDVLGYRISNQRRLLRNDNGYRFQRKLNKFAKAYAENKVDFKDIDPFVHSWIGHAKHAETEGLRTKVFSGVKFQRAST